MDPAHLHELAKLEESYWWHVAKRSLAFGLIERFAKPNDLIIEGGVGAAGNLRQLQDRGYRVHGLDLMPEAIQQCQRRGIQQATQHDLCEQWPIAPSSAKIVLLLDVLEHLPHPVTALQHAAETLDESGRIILTVPAWPSLYSDWDKRLGHFRRYSSNELREHIQSAGLKLQWLNSWNAFTLPAAFFLRTWRRYFPQDRPAEFPPVSRLMNRLLISLATCERAWMKFGNVPTGLSLVAVASKK
jgi:2-polyprenyl-3-methyl-5-hydroxy-6-metoxy-1,4-benzoquinol methylase